MNPTSLACFSDDESVTVACTCNRLDHALRVSMWDSEGKSWLIEVTLPSVTLWHRLRRAWKYILGGEPSVADVVVESADIKRIADLVDRSRNRKAES